MQREYKVKYLMIDKNGSWEIKSKKFNVISINQLLEEMEQTTGRINYIILSIKLTY